MNKRAMSSYENASRGLRERTRKKGDPKRGLPKIVLLYHKYLKKPRKKKGGLARVVREREKKGCLSRAFPSFSQGKGRAANK